MDKRLNQEKLKHEVENIGVRFEKLGIPPMPSRVFGLLLLAEPPYCTFEEMVNFLQASKSAISNSIKYLETLGIVTYKTFPGDRKRYFCVSEYWGGSLEAMLAKIRTFIDIFDRVLELRSAKSVTFNNNIADIRNLYVLFEKEMPKIMERWETERKKK